MPKGAPLAQLSTEGSLSNGRAVLLESCVKCHDLKTILAKPRSPSGWWNTVERMSEKPALFQPISEREMYDVTAYLIAITPDLQRSSKQKKQIQVAHNTAVSKATAAVIASPGAATSDAAPANMIDLARAKMVFEEVCSQCHELTEVTKAPPKTALESREMIQRMIKDNEAELTAEQIEIVSAWLDAEYVLKKMP